MLIWFAIGLLAWCSFRFVVRAFYTVGPNERAVLTSFGRAQRLGAATTLDDPLAASLLPEESARYVYPQVRVVGPGVHRRWPWQQVHKA
jgi:regulator of protease activity HflC (stomatin/prohibitin superfamily)